MLCPTANDNASVEFARFQTPSEETERANVLKRYYRWYGRKVPSEEVDVRPEIYLYKVLYYKPEWLETVQRRIQNSILPYTKINENDGRWLKQSVANAASDFFLKAADLLPSEPYIYSSVEGDLVAEFNAAKGPLTAIVSPDFVVLFAAPSDGAPIHKSISDFEQLRDQLKKFTDRLGAMEHGSMDS